MRLLMRVQILKSLSIFSALVYLCLVTSAYAQAVKVDGGARNPQARPNSNFCVSVPEFPSPFCIDPTARTSHGYFDSMAADRLPRLSRVRDELKQLPQTEALSATISSINGKYRQRYEMALRCTSCATSNGDWYLDGRSYGSRDAAIAAIVFEYSAELELARDAERTRIQQQIDADSVAAADAEAKQSEAVAAAAAAEAAAAESVAENEQQKSSKAQENSDRAGTMAIAVFIGIIVIIAIAIWLLPTIIAFRRRHAYRWIILVISLLGPLWLVALIWAIFPSDKSLIDPVVGNVTGLGQRNAGDTIGAAKFGAERGYSDDARSAGAPAALNATAIEKLERLSELYKRGVLTDDEFAAEKEKLLSRI